MIISYRGLNAIQRRLRKEVTLELILTITLLLNEATLVSLADPEII